ncbi:acyl-CoA dehydrogenase family protein [Bordetella sp. BOR01]|uniref:acyl-CoA dehydrogenase family protein n=1 Tax=Bordetella sp. BOR01 TaxID=2854779 RepID=UPI001C4665E4|nr:acyl-CoA dehydrogenase family protein [Bordetella sp. BOR01]MBV7486261.1 acyl-CoA dehydrogenase family protein [Bordetella sp. BOR01]
MTDSVADTLYESIARPLAELCPAATVRNIEDRQAHADAWHAIDALGYTDALIPDGGGGAGLVLPEVFGLLFAAGEAGLPFPFGDTIAARALLARAGHSGNGACIAIAKSIPAAGDGIACAEVPGAWLVDAFLVEHDDTWLLMPAAQARITAGTYRRSSGSPSWPTREAATARLALEHAGAAAWTNALRSAEMAGTMQAVLRQTIAYAQERSQFGKPLGRFQAVQQDISVLAEQVASVAMAARLGCAATAHQPDPTRAAMARLRACEAVPTVCAIAHAVHGAIGVTDELTLGLRTARLREWRATGASEQQCAATIGAHVLAGPARPLLDIVRDAVTPA